jgi:hypothetical protein
MKISFIFLFAITILLTSSCKKDENRGNSFYNLDYRTGVWVNSARGDTLEFVDAANLIRHYSFFSSDVHYFYRIEGRNIYIQEPSSMMETEHPVIKSNGSQILIGNMYITAGFADNSGIFKKIE